jgi:exosortase/archaeosortase family protein
LSVLATEAQTKAGEAHRGLGLPRRAIFLWVCAIIFLNQLFVSVNELPPDSPRQLLSDLGSVSFFQLMAWYAIFRLLASCDPTQVARIRDFLIALALCVPLFVLTNHIIWVVALLAAILGLIGRGGDSKLRAAGTVLAALSVQEFWAHNFFNLFALPLLRAETAVVGTILQAARAGTTWQDNIITGPSGFGIIVYSTCSSFHNLSLAMLCWLTVSRLRNQNWQSRDLVTGGVIGITMIACNVTRLCVMAWSPELYEYWHDGLGAQFFAVGASVLVLLLSLYGSRPAARAI